MMIPKVTTVYSEGNMSHQISVALFYGYLSISLTVETLNPKPQMSAL